MQKVIYMKKLVKTIIGVSIFTIIIIVLATIYNVVNSPDFIQAMTYKLGGPGQEYYEKQALTKDILTLDDIRSISKRDTRYQDIFFKCYYDYSDDIFADAKLIHVQATDESNYRRIWKFYENSNGTYDLVIDCISDDNSTLNYDSDAAYVLIKDVHFDTKELPLNMRYLANDDVWYTVDEINASLIYTRVDKILTIGTMFDKYRANGTVE